MYLRLCKNIGKFVVVIGSHDLLYQEFLPLLSNLLQGNVTVCCALKF